MGAYTSTPVQGQSHWLGPQNGARPKLSGLDLPTPVPGKPPPRSQPRADFSNLQLADLKTSLMDTVAQLQSEVYVLKFSSSTLALFTSTEVFSGSTSWDQYRPVFDAIVKSNGWDDATVALQLLCHLEGDALNVALLVPEPTQATWIGLVRAPTNHYGSPGRLVDYRSQFERTVRRDGEDPSDFAVALESIAVKAFGDMGQNARTRLICDRFIAGHPDCDLHWHLDSVPPDTPIQDIVDRCRVWGAMQTPMTGEWLNQRRIRLAGACSERPDVCADGIKYCSHHRPFGGINRPQNNAETPASGRNGTGTASSLCTHGHQNDADAPASGRNGTSTVASLCTH